MSNALKLSTALPGDDEINGLDVLAEPIVTDPSQMICVVAVLDVKDVRYITDLEAHVPTLRFRRGEAWPLSETPEAVRVAMIERAEQRLGRTPLPFGEVLAKKADNDKPQPDDCDHVDFTVERDHLEDVPEGTFRSTCLRCGWIEYHPIEDLDEQMERAGLGKGELDAQTLPGVRTGDEPEVWVFEGKPQASVSDLAAAAVLHAVEGEGE